MQQTNFLPVCFQDVVPKALTVIYAASVLTGCVFLLVFGWTIEGSLTIKLFQNATPCFSAIQ